MKAFLLDEYIEDVMKFTEFLQGKKTYIMALLLAVYALSGYFTGNLTGEQTLQLLWGSGVLGSLKSALTKLEK
jgi:hypothetical protein